MIRHIVLMKYRPDVAAEDRAALMEDLGALCARLPGILRFAAHRNISPETPVTHGFDDGFVIDLSDESARDTYLAEPRHVAIGARLTGACEGGAKGLIVFDHEI
jgi:hypothetical protein